MNVQRAAGAKKKELWNLESGIRETVYIAGSMSEYPQKHPYSTKMGSGVCGLSFRGEIFRDSPNRKLTVYIVGGGGGVLSLLMLTARCVKDKTTKESSRPMVLLKPGSVFKGSPCLAMACL